jgi:hypothetical protein
MEQATLSIQDKIRAAAIDRGIDPDVALRIANAESSTSNAAKNTRSSARGLFQIIDSTWKNFGGDPTKRDDVDENIRVGLNVISGNRDSFLKRFGKEPNKEQIYGMHVLGTGDAFKVFNAAEDAAIKNIVPKKVIKANPYMDKMSVADFIGFTQNKMAKKGTPATVVAKTDGAVPMPQAPKDMMREATNKKPSSRTVDLPTATNPTAPPMNRDLLASLGPSYQAALGAISLADSAEDDDDELLAEKYADRFGDQGNEVVPSTLGDIQLSYASPFEEPSDASPVQMASGGEVGVQKMAFGGIPYKPSALIPSRVKNQVTTAQSALDEYNNQVNSYNDRLNDYSNQVNEYNTKAEEYRRQAEDYNNQVNAYNEQRNQYLSSFIGGENPTLFTNFGGSYLGGGKAIPTKTPNLNVILGKGGKTPQYYIRQGEYRSLGEPSAPGDAPTFSASAPNAPSQPTAPTQTVESANAAVAAAKEKQRRLQLTYDVMEDPERFNLSMPALFAGGGEAESDAPLATYTVVPNSAAADYEKYLQAMKGVKTQEAMTSAQRDQAMNIRSKIFDPITEETLQRIKPEGRSLYNSPMLPREITAQNSPSTLFAGIPGAKVLEASGLKDTNTRGFILAPASEGHMRTEDIIFLAPPLSKKSLDILYKQSPKTIYPNENPELSQRVTLAHETEHNLKRRAGVDLNDTFDNLTQQARDENYIGSLFKKPASVLRKEFVNDAVNVASYLKDKFKVSLPGYFREGAKPYVFDEQVASLAGLEETFGVDLTQDPFLRETLFNDADVRRAFRAITGLRQTRLDAKDLAPHTLTPDAPYYPDASKIRNRTPTPVKRNAGSPVYGEMADSGGITPDTRAAMSNFQVPNAREALAALKKIYGEGISNAESLARGSFAAVPGTFGDIGQEFDIRGLRNLPTTEQLLAKYPQRLTQPTAETSKFENVGQYMPPPIPPAAISGTAKAMMKGLRESGPQVESIMRKIAPAAEPFYIVRPAGGEFSTVKSINEAPISTFDQNLASLYTSRPGPDYAPVTKFFDTKIRDYFKKQAGSVSDPVREALIAGKIKIPKGSDLEEVYPEALIKAARDGDVTAMKLIERELDKGLNLKTYKLENSRVGSGLTMADFANASNETRLAILQQMKNNPNIIPDAMLLRVGTKNSSKLSPEQAAKKVADIRAKLKDNPELFSTIFEEKIIKMMSQAEDMTEVVTPEGIEKYSSLYGKLKGIAGERKGIMSLEGAAPIIDVAGTKGSTLFGMPFDRIHTLMQNIPPKELERMDVPTMLNRVIQLDNVASEAASYTTQAEKLISAGKAVPEKISTYGTKPFITKDRQGFTWREITEPDAATIQGKLLGNSIGGYALPGTYGKLAKGRIGLTNGEVRLFGLYDNNNQLVSNVEYLTKKADVSRLDPSKEIKPNTITQFFGNGPNTGNAAPENYLSQVIELVNKLNPDEVPPTIQHLFYKNNIFFDDATGQVTNR